MLLAGPHVAAPAQAEPRILWRLENPFRFFTDPADTEMHRATFVPCAAPRRSCRCCRRSARWPSATRPRLGGDDGGPRCWNPARNRHVCADARDYLQPHGAPAVFELRDVEDAAAVDCAWVMQPQGARGKLAG